MNIKNLIMTSIMALSLMACGNKNETPQNEKPTVKIGVILPLSGDLAVWGNSEKQGLLLAKDALSGDAKNNYQLIFEDSANVNKNIQHIAQKLISVDKIDAVITMFDPAANIVGPMASANKILHFGQSWFPKYVNDKYNYNVYADIKDEAKLIVEYLSSKDIKKVYLFTVNQTGFIGGTNMLKEMLAQKGIAYDEMFFNFGQNDFRIDIVKANKFEAEAYVIGAFAPEADILAKQLKQINGNNIILTGLDLGLNIANRDIYEGSVFASPGVPNQDFIKNYKSMADDDNYLFGATVGFVSFNAIVDAFENSENKDKEKIADFLLQKNSVSSVYKDEIAKKGGMIYLPSKLLTISDGKLVSYEE